METASERSRPVVMQFTRLGNYWKAYDRLGHEVDGEHFTAGEMQIIKVVAEYPAKNTTELADELGVTKGAISQAVTKLVARGHLERFRAVDDERQTFTRLTSRGSRVYQAHMRQYAAELAEVDQVLADAEPGQVEFLRRFVARVEGFFRERVDGVAR